MRKTILIAIGLVFILQLGYAQGYRYAGILRCKVCHFGVRKGYVYEKWKKSPHGKAFETLKAVGQEKNTKCLPCHTTGFGLGGYWINHPGGKYYEGVGCESCHGAGYEYKAMSIMKDKKRSIANGLIIPTEAVCKKCHNEKSPTYKGFNYQEALVKIDHKYRK